MLNIKDKKGTHVHPQNLLDGFKKAVEDCNLVELDLMGGQFTWEKSRGSSDWVRERLDRAFASPSWWKDWIELLLLHLGGRCSLYVS